LQRENALLSSRNGDSDYNGEVHRALWAIPAQFVGNDAWENGVQRLAEDWEKLQIVLTATRRVLTPLVLVQIRPPERLAVMGAVWPDMQAEISRAIVEQADAEGQ
jgi:hypothetical protein